MYYVFDLLGNGAFLKCFDDTYICTYHYIIIEFNLVNDCKKRWKNIRDTYMKNKKNQKQIFSFIKFKSKSFF